MKRSTAWLTLIVGLNLLLASIAGLVLPVSAQTGVGGYTLGATAAATRQIFRPENNIIPAETLLDLSIPYSTSSLTQGSGRAVGSTAWPGDTLATACRAEPSIPCYPYYAEALYPQGPADGKAAQEIPGSTMSAHAEEQEAVGKAELTPQGGGGNSFGAMSSMSTTSIKGGTALAESVSRVSDIVIGGGAIRIEEVVSRAKAVSDGTTADAAGSTAVVGFTIAGIPVSVTSTGVDVAGQVVPNPLGPVVDPVNATLDTLGVQVVLSNPVVTKEGGKADVLAGGLIISFDNAIVLNNIPPEVKGNFPIDPTGRTTLVFGQASASSDASPGFGDFSVVEDALPVVADLAESAPAGFTQGDTVVEATEPIAPSIATNSGPTVQAANTRGLVDTKAVGIGLVLAAMIGAGAIAVGLKRLGTNLFQPIPVTACPQERP